MAAVQDPITETISHDTPGVDIVEIRLFGRDGIVLAPDETSKAAATAARSGRDYLAKYISALLDQSRNVIILPLGSILARN